ncbi:MAG: DUF6371 domain-containing protein [Psychroflexus halocasei]
MYKYTLDKTSKKHICPNCNKKRFVRYIDVEVVEYLSHEVGRCDREINCGYHYTPKAFFKDHNSVYDNRINIRNSQSISKRNTSYHNWKDVNDSLVNNGRNNFIRFLNSIFSDDEINKMLSQYKIGTARNWYHATIFWQIDQKQKIRGGKIISYDENGKRTPYINWYHSIALKKKWIKTFELSQCLFGLHLLKENSKPIAIVESEKTACVMSLCFDKYLWLATGSLNGLNEKKISPIKNEEIILYPDLGIQSKKGTPYEQWKIKATELQRKGYDIKISDLLEKKGNDHQRENGYDLADYFLKNENKKPRKIISAHQQKYVDFYLKNQNLKTLIDVFDLQDEHGNKINL